MMKPLTVSVADACQYIGIGPTKLYELIKDGQLAVVKLGRRTLVTTESIEQLLGLKLAA